MKIKRLIITTILGAIFGLACFWMASSGQNETSPILAASIILSRTLIGFAIGISRFSFKHWSLHGIIMGLLFSLPAGFGAMLGPEVPGFGHTALFISTVVIGMVYGFLIELITSVVFKAKMKA